MIHLNDEENIVKQATDSINRQVISLSAWRSNVISCENMMQLLKLSIETFEAVADKMITIGDELADTERKGI
jgi:translation initiation factor 2B subunit (eIF-2B alpha/beta/delta family)